MTMNRNFLKFLPLLLLLSFATGLLAQQSNKSKSKDRYREKDMLSRSEVNQAIDHYGALRSLAEQQFRPTTFALSEAMLRERTNAPNASRYFAYALLAGYETTARYQAKVSTLNGVLRGMPMILSYSPADSVFYPFASLYAILETGRQLLPSGYTLAQQQVQLEQLFRQNGLPESAIRYSKTAAGDISNLILEYANADGYSRLTNRPTYPAANTPGSWTVEGAPAVEPYWAYLRPFLLESAQQFAGTAPAPYDLNAGSPYLALVQEVFEVRRTMVPEQYTVANFWACDPNGAVQPDISHITPPGRWINICGLACEQQRLPFISTITTHTLLALGMADAVIACWEGKYRNNRARPQTVINQVLDPNWRPVLVAPAYPANPSLHCVVASVAAELLSRTLGENIPVVDNTEQIYGVPPRQYPSFRLAAEEAAWSRLFAGLQFRDGIISGQELGRKVGYLSITKWPVGQ